MDFFERLARAWNVLWGIEETPPREAFAPSASPPPPIPSGIGRTVAPGAIPPVIRQRERQPSEKLKKPDGILVRLLVDYQRERISVPIIFDEEAIAEVLPQAPATLAAGTGNSEHEILEEIVAQVASRGTPPMHFKMDQFIGVHGGVLLFGSAAHVSARLPFAIPHMARVMGEVWYFQDRPMFSARKGLSGTGLVVEIAGSSEPTPFNASSPPLPIPPTGIIVRQVMGVDKYRNFAPIPSAIAWEIVPRYV